MTRPAACAPRLGGTRGTPSCPRCRCRRPGTWPRSLRQQRRRLARGGVGAGSWHQAECRGMHACALNQQAALPRCHTTCSAPAERMPRESPQMKSPSPPTTTAILRGGEALACLPGRQLPCITQRRMVSCPSPSPLAPRPPCTSALEVARLWPPCTFCGTRRNWICARSGLLGFGNHQPPLPQVRKRPTHDASPARQACGRMRRGPPAHRHQRWMRGSRRLTSTTGLPCPAPQRRRRRCRSLPAL